MARYSSLKSFLSSAVILFLCTAPSVAFESAGNEIVYIDCQPNSSLHVKTMVLFDINPVLDKRTFDMAKLTKGQGKQECQISKAVKATIYMSGDGGQILLNNKMVGAYIFTDPDSISEYFITNLVNGIDIDFTEIHGTKVKDTTTHFNPDEK